MQSLRARLRQFWLSRVQPRDGIRLHQRNVYIVPTGPGWMLGVTLLILLVASINYQLNLGYLLTFLLAGSALASMHVCHGTLRGLQLQLLPPQPQFAGAAAALQVQLHNPGKAARYAIGVGVLGTGAWSWADVPPQSSISLSFALSPQSRGLQSLPALSAETRYPLGTVRAWTVWRPASQLLVYPAPEIHPPPLPAGQAQGSGQRAAQPVAGDEFDGVRAYRAGDAPRLVVWKKVAQTGQLFSRDSPPAQTRQLWLDLAQTHAPTLEARLSRLCAWVLLAETQSLHYGLRLGSLELPPAQGQTHQQACLRALALHAHSPEP
jgi:uncharacterized protein (DUF58 family)